MDKEDRVVISDVKMPFLSMVIFMVKWSLASVPAVLILAVSGWLSFLLLSSLAEMVTGPTHQPSPFASGSQPSPFASGSQPLPLESDPELYRMRPTIEASVVSSTGAALRSAATERAAVVAQLEHGERVRLLPNRRDQWQQVVVPERMDGQGGILRGWLEAELVQPTESD